MISARVRFESLRFNVNALMPKRTQMKRAGDVTVQAIKDRLRHGVGVDDRPMKSLTYRYRQLKIARTGRGIRDANLTGRSLATMKTEARDGEAVITVLTPDREAEEWLGISENDTRKLMAELDKTISANADKVISRA